MGREKQYPQKAAEIMTEFFNKLKAVPDFNIEVEQALTKQGGRFTMIIINKK